MLYGRHPRFPPIRVTVAGPARIQRHVIALPRSTPCFPPPDVPIQSVSMPRGDLFPEIGPYETGYLPLSAGHVMYWEQAGNPNGRPVLFLHGGPGAGAGTVHRRFFDPGHWRIVIFDQRGAGRSRPLGGLDNNTTSDLVADIEILRRHLAIDRFLLFGGSWGSTLALAYAQAHPERVAGAVLRGVFLGRPQEVEWFLPENRIRRNSNTDYWRRRRNRRASTAFPQRRSGSSR